MLTPAMQTALLALLASVTTGFFMLLGKRADRPMALWEGFRKDNETLRLEIGEMRTYIEKLETKIDEVLESRRQIQDELMSCKRDRDRASDERDKEIARADVFESLYDMWVAGKSPDPAMVAMMRNRLQRMGVNVERGILSTNHQGVTGSQGEGTSYGGQ